MASLHRAELGDIGTDDRGWRLETIGDPARPTRVVLESVFGRWVYGRHPNGYDTWWFHERGGGGAMTLPFCEDGPQLLVALVEEERPNLGPGLHLCGIGGFLDPGETHAEAQAREADEEAGIGSPAAELPGLPLNSNRGFFVADASLGEGVHVYALRVDHSELVTSGDGTWKFAEPRPSAERLRLVFLPWVDAVRRSADALALAAISRLLAALNPSGDRRTL